MKQFSKLRIFLIFSISLFGLACGAQDCLPAGISFSSQKEIDSFTVNYPSCTRILGDVYISDTTTGGVSRLEGLSILEFIGGDLVIMSQSLADLQGLEALDTIVGTLRIADNGPSLVSIEALNNLQAAQSIIIEEANIQELEFTEIESLQSLVLNIESVDSILDFSSLEKIDDYLAISSDSLISLDGFENLRSVDSFVLTDNSALATLEGLQNLDTVRYLAITDNPKLGSLFGIDQMSSSLSEVIIEQNSQLTLCHIQALCDFLVVDSAIISDNAPGCNTQSEVELNCGFGCSNSLSHNYNALATDTIDCMTCDDGIMNGDETEVDCGGELCPPCDCIDSIVINDVFLASSKIIEAARVVILDSVVFSTNNQYIIRAPEVLMSPETEAEYGSMVTVINDTACINCESLYWVQLGSDITGNGNDGYALELDASGQTVVIGASSFDGVDERVFEWDGLEWVQKGENLVAEQTHDRAGAAVATNMDGTRVAIGARSNDDPVFDQGHVRVYEWDGNEWQQLGSDIDGEAEGDFSGYAVDFDATGNRLAVGAPYNVGDTSSGYAGHVRVYEWINGAWLQVGNDIDGRDYHEYFGSTLSLSSNGDRICIGQTGVEGQGPCSFLVFDWDGASWNEVGDETFGSGTADYCRFEVDMNDEGDVVSMAASFRDFYDPPMGHVKTFELVNAEWEQRGDSLEVETQYEGCGYSISLNSDGSRLAIGVVDTWDEFIGGYSDGLEDYGVLYEWSGSSWEQLSIQIVGESTEDQFGWSIDLNSQGTIMALGGPFNGEGVVKIYRLECHAE